MNYSVDKVVEYYKSLKKEDPKYFTLAMKSFKDMATGGKGDNYRGSDIRTQFYRGYSNEYFLNVLQKLNIESVVK